MGLHRIPDDKSDLLAAQRPYLLNLSSALSRVYSNISTMPVRAAKGINWPARLLMGIRRCRLGSGCGSS